jgi:ribosome biogenesis GTPase
MDRARNGLVIAHYGRTLLVEGEDGREVNCAARRSATHAVCGDEVHWREERDGGVVLAVLPRRTTLARPDQRGMPKALCANIDQIVVVGSARNIAAGPDAGERMHIDAYLAAAEMLGIEALLLVNKSDLLTAAERAALDDGVAPYRHAGYPVIATSTRSREGMDELRARLDGRRSVLVGQSGVGKSSLSKVLLPDRDIRIGALSQGDGKGRHTTTVALLFHLPGGGDIIDSPGVRGFRLGKVEADTLAAAFRDFRPLLGHCRYRNCRHLQEPDCALARAVESGSLSRERLESYRALLDGVQET